jgi:signal transduction histidine kinase/AmiR/NasT family two-component response regulator
LRAWTLTVLALGFAVLVVAQIIVGRHLYSDGFREAEERDMLARVRHAQAVLAQTATRLRTSASDYGVWEDTHDFMRGRYPEYPTNNLYAGAFDRLQIDAVLFIDPRNQVALAKFRDPSGAVGSADAKTLAALTSPMLLSRLRTDQAAVTGYMVIDGAPYLWASAAIRPTAGNVPSAGHVVFFRALNAAFAADQGRQIDAAMQITVDARSSARPATAIAELRDLTLRADSAERVAGTVTLGRTVDGQAVSLTLTTARPLLATVREASTYYLFTSLAGGVLIALGVSWILSRRVLQPLERVAADVQRIGNSGAVDERLPTPQNRDEISAVVDALNRMLADLEAKRDVEHARDAALEASRLKSEFLATMSHEIRTPMNGVLGMLELVAASPLSAEQRQRVDTAHQSASNLLALLNDILDLSRLESGRLELDLAPTDLRAIVMQVGELMRARAVAKGLTLEWWVDEVVFSGYQADSVRLRQVLMNLVGNAVKFTEQGHVRVEVWGRPVDAERDCITLSVSDTGVGIAESAVDSIFEPFTQENAATTRRFGGSGLGLSICRRLVALMGGTIQVRSVQSVGSAFTVELQLERCEIAADPTVPMPDQAPLELHVLVAEDNRVNQLVVSAMLEKIGCSYELASDGAQAIALYRERPRRFAMILMDVNMPNVDGHEASRVIREFERTTLPGRRVPIIALTANAMNGDRERSLEAGMDDHLPKPFGMLELRQVLVRARRSRSVVEFPRIARVSTP